MGDGSDLAEGYKVAAVDLCLCLCELFGETLDRKTLWEKIGSALRTAAAKSDDGDTDRFMSLCLEHVRAEDGAASRCQRLADVLRRLISVPLAWRQSWVRYVASRVPAILAHSRAAWEIVKAERAVANV